jgi:GNAT superfamily N-acetyltransferase
VSGYRFCRTDDIPRLVDAYNACRGPECAEPAMTVADFKCDAREIGLWASSSMLAFDGDRVVAVLLGAKRDDANLVFRIVVADGHRRRGHGRHLLESLRNKVAILGPPRLLAEVPAGSTDVRRFFERCGFAAESHYADFVADRAPADSPSGAELVAEATVGDVLEAGAFDRKSPRSWERSLDVIRKRSTEIEALVIASDTIEAYALHRGHEVIALGARQAELLGLVITALHRRVGAPLRIPRLAESEAPFAALEGLGFRRETEYIGYSAQLAG